MYNPSHSHCSGCHGSSIGQAKVYISLILLKKSIYVLESLREKKKRKDIKFLFKEGGLTKKDVDL